MSKTQSPYDSLRHIPQYYDNSDSHNSALNLILALRPEWRDSKDTIEFARFTDGITNTVGILHSPLDRGPCERLWLSVA
jgi:ethanolamine kinase